jgi:hypothetical protein
MNKLILLFLVLLLQTNTSVYATGVKYENVNATKKSEVYICDNGKTSVYHINSGCSALGRCKHGVSKMKESEAKGIGLRACKKC